MARTKMTKEEKAIRRVAKYIEKRAAAGKTYVSSAERKKRAKPKRHGPKRAPTEYSKALNRQIGKIEADIELGLRNKPKSILRTAQIEVKRPLSDGGEGYVKKGKARKTNRKTRSDAGKKKGLRSLGLGSLFG